MSKIFLERTHSEQVNQINQIKLSQLDELWTDSSTTSFVEGTNIYSKNVLCYESQLTSEEIFSDYKLQFDSFFKSKGKIEEEIQIPNNNMSEREDL